VRKDVTPHYAGIIYENTWKSIIFHKIAVMIPQPRI
jgi:hypothetical protein